MIEELERDVSELTSEKVRMLQLVEEKDRQFVELENHVLLQEKKYLNELKVSVVTKQKVAFGFYFHY